MRDIASGEANRASYFDEGNFALLLKAPNGRDRRFSVTAATSEIVSSPDMTGRRQSTYLSENMQDVTTGLRIPSDAASTQIDISLVAGGDIAQVDCADSTQ